MNRITTLLVLLPLTVLPVTAAENPSTAAPKVNWLPPALRSLIEAGELLLTDDFDRADGSPSKDAIGRGWSSNSPWRADGRKQAFLKDGRLTLKTASGADHAVVIFHDLPTPFADGIVQLQFVAAADTAFSVDLNDPMCGSVHSGHIANIAVTKRGITIKDSKSGTMKLEHRRQLKSGTASSELRRKIASFNTTVPFQQKSGSTYVLTIVKCDQHLRLFIDGAQIADRKSAGFQHPTIRKISISVPGKVKSSPQLDSIHVWKLSADCSTTVP